MPNTAEIVVGLVSELEMYRMFAKVMGYPTKEAAMQKLDEMLQKGWEKETAEAEE